MKRVRIAELKSELSRHLRAVERGEELEVTDRDRPIARIVPVRARPDVVITKARVAPRMLRARRPRPAGWSVDSLTLLLHDRRSR
jgi:prevent-host-death family protein